MGVKGNISKTIKPGTIGTAIPGSWITYVNRLPVVEREMAEHKHDYISHVTEIERGFWDNKVDRVFGKGLSTCDYSPDERDKLSRIEDCAQVNTVESVAGRVGRVKLNKSDVGLDKVANYAVASLAEAEAGLANDRYMTPLRVAQAIASLAAPAPAPLPDTPEGHCPEAEAFYSGFAFDLLTSVNRLFALLGLATVDCGYFGMPRSERLLDGGSFDMAQGVIYDCGAFAAN